MATRTYYRGDTSFCLRETTLDGGGAYCPKHLRWYRERLLRLYTAVQLRRELDKPLALR